VKPVECNCLKVTVENAYSAMNSECGRKAVEVKVNELNDILVRA